MRVNIIAGLAAISAISAQSSHVRDVNGAGSAVHNITGLTQLSHPPALTTQQEFLPAWNHADFNSTNLHSSLELESNQYAQYEQDLADTPWAKSAESSLVASTTTEIEPNSNLEGPDERVKWDLFSDDGLVIPNPPSLSPTFTPTKVPTAGPTVAPSAGPTRSPTSSPTSLNLISYGKDLTNAVWMKASMTVSTETGIGPDGSSVTFNMLMTGYDSDGFITQNVFVTQGASYRIKFYAKFGQFLEFSDTSMGTDIFFHGSGYGSNWSIYSGSPTAITMASTGFNDWYELSFVFTASKTIAGLKFRTNRNPDDYNVIYVWDMRLELVESPTVAPTAVPTTPTVSPTQSPSSGPTTAPTAGPTAALTAAPSLSPTQSPSAGPTTVPTAGPTVAPSAGPTFVPSAVPSISPTQSPSAGPTTVPTAGPTVAPSAGPTFVPSVVPSISPTQFPSAGPTTVPTAGPTVAPSAGPTVVPSAAPSISPTQSPSSGPTTVPTAWPSAAPSVSPTSVPSVDPTVAPSAAPTQSPTQAPSVSPTQTPSAVPSGAPTAAPTVSPSVSPTVVPSEVPSALPTASPSFSPTTVSPSVVPSALPTQSPSSGPTTVPTAGPSAAPSVSPTPVPSVDPTVAPSEAPSMAPTVAPSAAPTQSPTQTPSAVPSGAPTAAPTLSPSVSPTAAPSVSPTTVAPTVTPSVVPSALPTASPSFSPTPAKPTATPSAAPSRVPTPAPTISPTGVPTQLRTLMPTAVQSSIPPTMEVSGAPSIFQQALSLSVVYGYKNDGVSTLKIVLPFLYASPAYEGVLTDIVLAQPGAGTNYFVMGGPKRTNNRFNVDPSLAAGPAVGYDYGARSASSLGDVNGDGYPDFIVGMPGLSKAYVMFGNAQGYASMTQGFTLFGANPYGWAGFAVSDAGDVNGDGLSDILIGAPLSDNALGVQTGAAYVIYGRRDMGQDIVLKDLLPSQGLVIYGAGTGDYAGLSVSNAGDVNDDGFDDVIVGAFKGNNYNSGGAYLIYGGPSMPAVVNVNSPAYPVTTFVGPAWSWSGYSVSGAGDVNGDGIGDVLIGSLPHKGSIGSPVSYLVYGSASLSSWIELNRLSSEQGLIMSGGGVVVRGVGDVNDDGFADVALGGEDYAVLGNKGFVLDGSILVPTLSKTPSVAPTLAPTTAKPSQSPTAVPTAPTSRPSSKPTSPTFMPTLEPTQPTSRPSARPTAPSAAPTESPTPAPSVAPSTGPTQVPTFSPTMVPTRVPTRAPSRKPTLTPTTAPFQTRGPVARQTTTPTESPSQGSGEIIIIKGGTYQRGMEPVHYIIKTNALVNIVGEGGPAMFTIYPNQSATVQIANFNLTTDVVDLRQFNDIKNYAALQLSTTQYLRGSKILLGEQNCITTVGLTQGQSVGLIKIDKSVLQPRNFMFNVQAKGTDAGDFDTKTIFGMAVGGFAGAALFFWLSYRARQWALNAWNVRKARKIAALFSESGHVDTPKSRADNATYITFTKVQQDEFEQKPVHSVEFRTATQVNVDGESKDASQEALSGRPSTNGKPGTLNISNRPSHSDDDFDLDDSDFEAFEISESESDRGGRVLPYPAHVNATNQSAKGVGGASNISSNYPSVEGLSSFGGLSTMPSVPSNLTELIDRAAAELSDSDINNGSTHQHEVKQ